MIHDRVVRLLVVASCWEFTKIDGLLKRRATLTKDRYMLLLRLR